MRGMLDGLYRLCGGIGALLIVAICLVVLIQVAFNLFDKISDVLFGKAIGLVLPSYAELAGYFLVAATFFALTNTLQHGVHIRVTMITQRLKPAWARIAEGWACLVGTLMSGYFAVWSYVLVYESWIYNDLSPGMLPIPIWLPQLPMAIGLTSLTICFADLFFQVIRGTWQPPVTAPLSQEQEEH
ncbi:TRAP transporter small permease subunit [Roseibium sp. HPY-6]|uniref:TRAP transporter small permease n=1 Tax=Roseibium sp. HPY-6 TaxID=3229852 RepID=UPI00338DD7F7